MKTILITGSGGLIGSEAVEFFLKKEYRVIGVDNNYRKILFGEAGSVQYNIKHLVSYKNYIHYTLDIRDAAELENIFTKYNTDIECIIHCAAQPSHDWAVKDPFVDFSINATATVNLLELTRKHTPHSVFIYMSTNKVYGDNPNRLNLIELDTRFEIAPDDKYVNGIDESFSLDNCLHSLFGCSKLSADVYVQEYGKYFGMKTTIFRGGCLTGSKHSGTQLHGFLNYLIKCNLTNTKYNIFGYKGKQVRDNIHSEDLISAFYCVLNNAKYGEVYNIGGGRHSNCSVLEAITKIENITNIKTYTSYVDTNRIGDHIWWISDTNKFKNDYPEWTQNYNLDDIIYEIINNINL